MLSAVTGNPTHPIHFAAAGAKPPALHANKNSQGLCTHRSLSDLQEALWGSEGAAGCKTVAICCQAESVVMDQSHYMWANTISVPNLWESSQFQSKNITFRPTFFHCHNFFSELNPKPLLYIFSADISITSAQLYPQVAINKLMLTRALRKKFFYARRWRQVTKI